jgi:hypothetical protein
MEWRGKKPSGIATILSVTVNLKSSATLKHVTVSVMSQDLSGLFFSTTEDKRTPLVGLASW